MTTDIHLLSGAYAVDAVDDAERIEFERHLAGCASCRDEVDGLREAAAELSVLTAVAVPAGLRAAVLEQVATVRPLPPELGRARLRRVRRAWAGGAALVAAAVLAVVLLVNPFSSDDPVRPTGVEQVRAADDVRTYRQSIDGADVTWYVSQELDQVAVVADGLESLPSDRVYELWFSNTEGAMIPAGFLEGRHETVLDGALATHTGAGITVEPSGGSQEPTLPPVTVVEFS